MTKRILVLCTGNSCRSIMAEALFNHLGRGEVTALSAGSHPAGHVNPEAIATLARHGIDPGKPQSKNWDVFSGQSFDMVVTVCDRAAGESCPVFLGPARKIHWSIPDPAHVPQGDAARVAFDQVFAMLREKISALLHTEDGYQL